MISSGNSIDIERMINHVTMIGDDLRRTVNGTIITIETTTIGATTIIDTTTLIEEATTTNATMITDVAQTIPGR